MELFNKTLLINLFAIGFGSTSRQMIQANGVHYDCGCVLTQNGDLMQFERTHPSLLNVPAIYLAYFSTFGALVSFLLFKSLNSFLILGVAFVIIQ